MKKFRIKIGVGLRASIKRTEGKRELCLYGWCDAVLSDKEEASERDTF